MSLVQVNQRQNLHSIWFGCTFCAEGRQGWGFKLVGECYIHGIMDGEAIVERDMESLSQDFQLL
jgi:hypothetical protein